MARVPICSSEAIIQRALDVRAAASARLQAAREQAGLTETCLGRLVGLKQVRTHEILTGTKSWPSLRALLYLALTLDVPLSQLLLPEPIPADTHALAAQLHSLAHLPALLQLVARWPAADRRLLLQLVTLLEHQRAVLPGFVAMLEATAVPPRLNPPPCDSTV